jgi:hypothetical protein
MQVFTYSPVRPCARHVFGHAPGDLGGGACLLTVRRKYNPFKGTLFVASKAKSNSKEIR